MNQKALFYDIDGTLLSEKTGEVPESAIQALNKAREQGHLTFVNTGRTVCSIPALLKQMPFSGFLCGCGTYITYGDQVLLEENIPHARGREIIHLLGQHHAGAILEGVEDCYFSTRRSRFERIENTRRYFRNMGIGIETYMEHDNFDYAKFVFYSDDYTNVAGLTKDLETDMEVLDRQDGFYEVVPKKFSKATAIQYVLDYFHISLEDAYVFGDSSNDLSMFQAVPHAIAMENHDPILDPFTEFQTKTVEEDGIAYAMEHYGII